MRKNKIMVIGPRKSGKTTLTNKLNGDSSSPRQSPYLIYGKNTIDVPGQYLESPWMHSHIIASQQDCSCVVMISDPTSKKISYPPEFAKSFRVPVIGVISKVDLDYANIDFSEKELERAGVSKPYFRISALDKSLDYLVDKLMKIKDEREGGQI